MYFADAYRLLLPPICLYQASHSQIRNQKAKENKTKTNKQENPPTNIYCIRVGLN